MKVRMYNVGFGDCFCLRDRKKSLLVDFGTNNSRIEGAPEEKYLMWSSQICLRSRVKICFWHIFIWIICQGFFIWWRKRYFCWLWENLSSRCFSKRNEQNTGAAASGRFVKRIRTAKPSGQPVCTGGCTSGEQTERGTVKQGKLFENKYQALWPDTDVIRKETDEVYNRICEDGKFKEVMDVLLEFAEKLRLIVWSMTAEGNKPAETVEKKQI